MPTSPFQSNSRKPAETRIARSRISNIFFESGREGSGGRVRANGTAVAGAMFVRAERLLPHAATIKEMMITKQK
jgi:hypothetical protein